MAAGVAALAALTATGRTDDRRARTLRLLAGVLAEALIAGGVALALAGLLDV
jgi:hypothetical protein